MPSRTDTVDLIRNSYHASQAEGRASVSDGIRSASSKLQSESIIRSNQVQNGLLVQAIVNELAGIRSGSVELLRSNGTGTGNMSESYSQGTAWRPVFARCHFSGGSGTNDLVISLNSGLGTAYDVVLWTVKNVGTGTDINLRFDHDEINGPSPWTFQSNDDLVFTWTNPDSPNMTWGLEVGMATI